MLFRNDIFTWNALSYRLLEAQHATDRAWVICLDKPFPWPEAISWSEIAECAPTGAPNAIQLNNLTISRKKYRDEALRRIQPLVTRTPYVYDSKLRGNMVQEQAREIGCSERTLNKDLRRYWQGGQVPDALLPDFHLSGRKLEDLTAGRGRTPNGAHSIYQLTEDDIGYFKNTIEKRYLKDSRISMAAAFQRLLERHYTTLDGNGTKYILAHGARPSIEQFKHYLRSNYSLEVRLRGREGNKDFERDHRSKLGTVLADCLGVGHYYEIDATIADVYLVSTGSVDKIIGKPTFYLIIDRKSRLIVGFYVGMEHACWSSAMEAILSISADKQELCARYGVKYLPEDWPSHEIFPKEFLADRGEMLSKASGQVCDGLQVTVTSLPAMRPDWKPLVEGGFKLIHEDIRDVAPAYDPPSNAMRRRGKHYEKDACLTLKDFVKIILLAIIAHNRKSMPSYDLNLAEMSAGIMPSPLEIWNHNIVERAGLLTRYSEQRVRHALLPRDTASVTAEGIIFRGCHYTCSDAIEKGWFVSARKKSFTVNVAYDSRLVDGIYVYGSPSASEPSLAKLTARSQKYAGLSFAEVKFYERLKAYARPSIEQNRAQVMMDFHEEVDGVVDDAKDKHRKEGQRKSRTARRADIKVDRDAERRTERQQLAAMSPDSTAPVTEAKIFALPVREKSTPPNPQTPPDISAPAPTEMTSAQRTQEIRRKMFNGY